MGSGETPRSRIDDDALLAVRVAAEGDDAAARQLMMRARLGARTASRRQRQVVEIAALVVAGQSGRASGLACVHAQDFPEDVGLLARIASSTHLATE